MKTTHFSVTARSKITLQHTEGDKKAQLLHTDFDLDLSPELNEDQYFTPEKIPNKDGSHAITIAFVQGLASNIHYAHEKGYRDSAEHLRYIIAELERSFVVPVPKAEKGTIE